jgi:uncharacterized cofD-like protein
LGTSLAISADMLSMSARPETSSRQVHAQAASPRIVAIGGGTGLPTVLRGLRCAAEAFDWPDLTDKVTAIVTVMDDGGSSGQLRRSMGILPPGDIRNCLAALVRQPSTLSGILHDRLGADGSPDGHPIGNLLLAALTTSEGNFLRAVQTLSEQMGISGRVLPATLENVHLTAAFQDGEAIRGESAITARRGRIRRLGLERQVRPLPDAIEAIINADLIVVGPGSLYTSILPNLLVEGIAATISGVTARRVYVANLMTEPGETDDYSLGDHLQTIEEHTGFDLFDYVLVNRGAIPSGAVTAYAADGAHVVATSDGDGHIGEARLIAGDLATITTAGQIRHDPTALGFALAALARTDGVNRFAVESRAI